MHISKQHACENVCEVGVTARDSHRATHRDQFGGQGARVDRLYVQLSLPEGIDVRMGICGSGGSSRVAPRVTKSTYREVQGRFKVRHKVTSMNSVTDPCIKANILIFCNYCTQFTFLNVRVEHV